jgi:hypothetical protein
MSNEVFKGYSFYERMNCLPSLSFLGVFAPKKQKIDSGTGSTIYRVGPVVVKVYDLPGSEGLNIYGIRNFESDTLEVKKTVENLNPGLRCPCLGEYCFRWRVNPINATGLVNTGNSIHPWSLSPFVNGVSIGDFLDDNKELNLPGIETDHLKEFLKSELIRFNRLLKSYLDIYELGLINITALNTLVVIKGKKIDLFITSIRDYVLRRGPVRLRKFPFI